jgi:intermembrane space import and assembly protein 40
MQFREAFSCFVFSEQEPKGIDCVEKFKAMQDCFREHPEVYAEGRSTTRAARESPVLTVPVELDDDDDPDAAAELPEAAVLATEDSSLERPQDSAPKTKVHMEPSI